jgi:DNA-binding transcriptional LysR family regulator
MATLKSVTKTAKQLRVSQPVVSMRLATLQRDLGVELYYGTGRNFALTPAGRRVLGKCESIVLLANDLESEVRDTLLGKNTIRIGLTEIVALSWLPELLTRMDQAHLSASITTGPADELLNTLRDEKIDLALTIDTSSDPTLRGLPLCEFPIQWVAAPALIDRNPPLTVQDLARLPIIQSRRTTYRYEKMREYFEWHGVQNVEGLRPNHWIDVGFGMMTCAHLASKGVGVTALPVAVVAPQLENKSLVQLAIKEAFKPWQIAAICKKNVNIEVVKTTLDCIGEAVRAYASRIDSSFFQPLGSAASAGDARER